MLSISEPLTEAKAHYDELGYCIIDGIYSADELQAMENFFEAYRLREDSVFESPNGQWRETVKLEAIDKTKQQVRVLHPHRLDPKVMEWYLHPRLADVLEVLLGKPAFGAQTMFYYKPPGARGQGMHQDNFYLLAKPSTCIGAWTPIDDADEENGCLWVSPRSNHDDMHCPDGETAERWLNYGDSHITKFPRDKKPIPVPVKRGQTLFFSGNLIHGSGPNRSATRWRRTFIGHYVDGATEQLSRFYHPVLNMRGEVVSTVAEYQGGGPCGSDWQGGTH
ncbi:MAG: phytanoyl-CoA dioxygenase family protein [Verrucomicrobiota bacterium]|nr:phytanoyl-CoA dioxygenase family protein [Verrucomicrobiota bacterium]